MSRRSLRIALLAVCICVGLLVQAGAALGASRGPCHPAGSAKFHAAGDVRIFRTTRAIWGPRHHRYAKDDYIACSLVTGHWSEIEGGGWDVPRLVHIAGSYVSFELFLDCDGCGGNYVVFGILDARTGKYVYRLYTDEDNGPQYFVHDVVLTPADGFVVIRTSGDFFDLPETRDVMYISPGGTRTVIDRGDGIHTGSLELYGNVAWWLHSHRHRHFALP